MKTLNRIKSPSVRKIKGITSWKLFQTWLVLLSWCLGLDRHLLIGFGYRIQRLIDINGRTFTVRYLKECVRIVQHFIGGSPVFLSEGIPIDLTGGLPRIIPGKIRSQMRLLDPGNVRVALTVLSVFRVFPVDGELKLSTITDPFKGLSNTLPLYELKAGLDSLGLKFPKLEHFPPVSLVHSGSAGPNHKSSLFGLHFDVVAWLHRPDLLETLREFCSLMPGGIEFYSRLFDHPNLSDYQAIQLEKPYLGRLTVKEEAAGKVRVFAITDLITQTVMKPLHQVIFSQLKTLPMDGTFDQNAPLTRLNDLYKEGKIESFHSYDLSAATDRLPVQIQRDILSLCFGYDYASAWLQIMTDRDWTMVLNKTTEKYITSDVTVKYAVGQAMGALSSWAMLALTHHVIVQIAALRVGLTNFTYYAVLGDDVVIGNSSVAKSYHYIMTEILGVEINLSKSLISSDTFEFAKQIHKAGVNLTPIGPKNLLVAIKSVGGISSVFLDMVNKGYTLSTEHIENLFKVGIPTVNKKALSLLKWTILGPFGLFPAGNGQLSSTMKISRALLSVRVSSLISSIDDVMFKHDHREWLKHYIKSGQLLTKLALWSPLNWDHLMLEDENVCGSYTNVYNPDSSQDFGVSSEVFEGAKRYSYDLKNFILQDIIDARLKLEHEQPVRRFIFDGPILHFSFYREGFEEEIIKYISDKINKWVDPTVPVFDPFEDDNIVLPFKSLAPGENFFLEVRDLEKIKDAERYGT